MKGVIMGMFVKTITIVLFCLIDISAFSQNSDVVTPNHYPRLLQAEVPIYPGVAEGLRFGGTIEIDVVVEDGIIKNAKVKREAIEIPNGEEGWKSNVKRERIQPPDDEEKWQSHINKLMEYLTVPSLEYLKTWRFDPLAKDSFTITFIYKIEGEETYLPESPKIEMDLPLTIKVTTKPSKPQGSVPDLHAEAIAPPYLRWAEIPFYPPAAASMLFGGTIEIDVVVKNGVVRNAKIKRKTIESSIGIKGFSSDNKLLKHLTESSLKNVKTWQFAQWPNGSFTVTFIYKIEGEETLFPENPKIEMDLLSTVKITARPFKPKKSP